MRVSHYCEFEERITGGIRESVRHQRKALEKEGIEFTTEPDLDADLLHLNVMGPVSVYYALRALRKQVPVVVHTHLTAEDFGKSFRLSDKIAVPLRYWLQFGYSLADRLICPSDYNQGIIEEYTGKESTVISNGVDGEKLDGFEDLREEYMDRYDLEEPVVFNLGHVFKRKGLREFVETAEDMPELDFVWFGPKHLKLKDRETSELVRESPENCQFPGFIDDVRGAFAAGDIFFFPTHEENEGISLLEALYCGKPVVIRDIPTFNWLEDGQNCLKSDGDFAEELERMKDPDLRKEIGINARETGRKFSLDNIGRQMADLYSELV